MQLWLIVPVKSLHQGKSRLASVLSEAERFEFNQTCLLHLLQVTTGLPCLTGIVVVSHDPKVHQLAAIHGVHCLHEQGHTLNQALQQGRIYAMQQAADAILVLPTDLPTVQAEDIEKLYQSASNLLMQQGGILIVPSMDGGTNALLIQPPDAIDFRFGKESATLHQQQATQRNLPVYLHHAPSLQHDIDLPQHLAMLRTGSIHKVNASD